MSDLPAALAEVVAVAAVPARAGTAVGRLLGTHPDLADRLDGDATTALVAVAGASRSLARVLEADPEALDVLVDLDHRAEEDAADGPGLLAWKRRELLRIAARDLTARDAVDATAAALARLGDDVLAGAVRLAGAEGLAVIGMGKLGGGELNYASDIDLLFVGEGDPDALARDARRVLELARPCFRMDADLRPEGRDGPLVRSVAEVLGIRRYVQSHTLDTPINDALRASRNTEPRYDGVAELWWESVDDFVGRLADPDAQAASGALLEDERRFIDLEATSIFLTEEHEIIALG